MEIFLLLFWLLLLGAAACVALLWFRPTWVWPTAVGLLGFTLLAWLIIRPQLPLQAIFLSWSTTGFLPDWTWRLDTASWGLTLWLLLVVTAVSLHAWLHHSNPSDKPTAPASLLLLTAAALSAIWSDGFTGLLAGMTLLLASWLPTLWLAGERSSAFLFKGAILLIGLLLAWPIGSSQTTLLAAALLLNIWPLPLWQPRAITSAAVVASLMPPLAGALLLVRLLPVAQLSPAVSLLLTVLALIGFMHGIQLAWNRLHLPSYAVAALLLAQSHLLLLAAIWVGAAGVVAELRVLLLAGGVLYLLVMQPAAHRWLRLAAGGVSLAALAGLPLTAGFASRAGLYAIWLTDGRWALVLVLALLHLPLIMAGVWLLRQDRPVAAEENRGWQDWLRDALPLLPALGLLSVSNVIWGNVPVLAWLAILGAAAVGVGLPRLVGDSQRVRLMLRQALGTERPLFAGKLPTLKQVGLGVQTAVNDAADILDGDSGLLWLLLLAVIIILIG
jgi:hypothetical protein